MAGTQQMTWRDSALDRAGHQSETMDVVGYADHFSAEAGDSVQFMVSCRASEYDVQLVRLIHGDTSPQGPGFKEVELAAACNGTYAGRQQSCPRGSYVRIDDPSARLVCQNLLTIHAWIRPSLLDGGPDGTLIEEGAQGLVTRWDAYSSSGYALVLDAEGALCLWLGDGKDTISISTEVRMRPFSWYSVGASIDLDSRTVSLSQSSLEAWPGAERWPLDETQGHVVKSIDIVPASTAAPVLIGAWHNSSKPSWFDIEGHFNGKLERPSLRNADGAVAEWDFSQSIGSSQVLDISGNRHHGVAVNMPMRGVTGHNYSGKETDYRLAPDEYGAIAFHADDLEDARWAPSFDLTITPEMKSAVYAIRLRTRDVDDGEDYIPLFIRPPVGQPTSRIAFLVPTYSYLAYGSEHITWRNPGAPVEHNCYDYLQKQDYYVLQQELLSLYDHHRDGTGNCYASRLRPIVINFRPKYFSPLTLSPHQFNADLHLVDWLETKEFGFDVITDEDLHRDGQAVVAPYSVVLTGSHHEYWTASMLDAMEAYLSDGGRLMYLSGNGMYWPVGVDQERPHIIEVRRGQNGTGTWRSAPGENHLSTTGEPGGLWRDRGRAPQRLVGIGMAAAGYDQGGWYERTPASFDPRVRFIFEGIAQDAKIGQHGLGVGGPDAAGGAVGLEVDRADIDLGTPPHALVVATSKGLSSSYQRAVEEVETTDDKQGAPDCPFVRADMVFFETPKGGAVFSTGSITWCAALSADDYESAVSRITNNVLVAFAAEGPLPT